MHKNTYTSVIDVLCKMGVIINRDALYERVERDEEDDTRGSGVQQCKYRFILPYTRRCSYYQQLGENCATIANYSSSAEYDLISMCGTSSNNSRCPK